MTIHVSATTGCNLGCTYCYEHPDRNDDAGAYDVKAILNRLKQFRQKYDEVPGLHGGEPLMMSTEDLERIFAWIYETYDLDETDRYSHIQTNGTLITDTHIDLFDRYRVSVGVSCDGPGELNGNRVAHDASGEAVTDVTEEMTERTLAAIDRLDESGINVGVITVLSEANAGTDERLDRLLDWMDDLTAAGIGGHFNPAIPYEDVQSDASLTPDRLKEVYLQTWEWMTAEPYRQWGPLEDFQDHLLGNGIFSCICQACDPFNTASAKIVTGTGGTTGCGKTWSVVGDGETFLQGDSTGNAYGEATGRYAALKQIPGPQTSDAPDRGGCKECRYWNICRGGCPSSGIEYDYRNRTRWCEAIYGVYERIEHDLRSMFPGIRLVTDAPWDAPMAEELARGEVDIAPFAGLHHGQSADGSPSASGGAHDLPDVWQIAREVDSFEAAVEAHRDRYPEEILEIDRERESIHVDGQP